MSKKALPIIYVPAAVVLILTFQNCSRPKSTSQVNATSVSQVTVSLTSNPPQLMPGQTVSLELQTQNAQTCTGVDELTGTTSGTVTLQPLTTTTYTVNCTGPNGQATANATVTLMPKPGYGGLYVVSSPYSGKTYYPLPGELITTPAVDGIYVSLFWKDIEPQEGVYDWTALDTLLNQGMAAGKIFELGVTGGAQSPGWIYTSGVPSNTFIINLPPNANHCHAITVPTYWDAKYISAFSDMLTQLAAHLKTQPLWYSSVRIIKIGGINTGTEETYIPAQEPLPTNPCTSGLAVTDANPIWQAAGYRPSLIILAWQQLAAATRAAFPDALLAFDILETGSDFPRIDETGTIVHRNPAISPTYVNVVDKLVTSAEQTYGGKISVQWDALSEFDMTVNAPHLVAARTAGTVIGWQTNGRGGFSVGSLCGTTAATLAPCTPPGYLDILQNGIRNGGSYIEVLPVNVAPFSAQMQSVRSAFAGF